MTYPSKPLEMRLNQVRESVPGLPHGDVHMVLDIKWAPKRKVTLCGLSTEGMRTQATPFSGWASVLCPECTKVMEV